MSAFPLITVVTPTFERVEFLEQCIESVLDQDYPHVEYVICDGGSTNPELLNLIRKYEHRLAWWDSMPDRGHAEAIRRGFDKTSGQVMTWLCSDDYFVPGALSAVADAFVAPDSPDVVYGHSVVVDAHGRVLKEHRAIPYCEYASFTTSHLYQPAAFWTRRLYMAVGGQVGGANWENVVYEPNVELFCRFQRSDAKFKRVKVMFTAMRTHPGTANSTSPEQLRRVSTATFRRYYPVLGRPLPLRLVKVVMRLYQVVALILQGDARFLWQAVRRRLSSRRADA